MSVHYLQRVRAVCANASAMLAEPKAWDPQNLALLFRQMSMSREFIGLVVPLAHEPVDLLCARLLPSTEPHYPLMEALFRTADNAAAGADLLVYAYPSDSTYEGYTTKMFSLKTARSLYLDTVSHFALWSLNPALTEQTPRFTVDYFKEQAITCFHAANAHPNPEAWAALLTKDVRWCLACPTESWAALAQEYPETKPWLDALDIHCQLLPWRQALRQVWAQPHLNGHGVALPEYAALPDLGLYP